MFRVGFGFDTHRLAPGYELWLGGVKIPHTTGSVGHSDGDVLIHACIDAMLGAAGLRDIGTQFPDTDPAYKGIDSKELLRRAMVLIREEGYEPGNLDATVVLQSPRLKDFIPEMKITLGKVMQVSPELISVKAKTSEGLGFIGREEGLSAYAVVLLERTV